MKMTTFCLHLAVSRTSSSSLGCFCNCARYLTKELGGGKINRIENIFRTRSLAAEINDRKGRIYVVSRDLN